MINARAWVSKLFSLETANFVLIPGVWTRYWFFAEFASPFQPQVGQIWSWLSHSQRGSHSIILKIKRSFHYWIHISQKRATYLTINICTYEFCPPIIFIANWTVKYDTLAIGQWDVSIVLKGILFNELCYSFFSFWKMKVCEV